MADDFDRVVQLIVKSYEEGGLSEESKEALRLLDEMPEIAHALGAGSSGEGELLLVTILVDDSASITKIPYGAEAVRLGHSRCLETLRREDAAEILVHTRFLNTGLLSPYQPLADAVELTDKNYSPYAPRTPLFRQTVLTLGTVMAKVQEERDRGRLVRAFTLLITDSRDNDSHDITFRHVRFLVGDMLEFATNYIVAGMGIGDSYALRGAFGAMGIPDRWILTPDATSEEISATFRRVAKALQLAAASEVQFAQLAAGPPDA